MRESLYMELSAHSQPTTYEVIGDALSVYSSVFSGDRKTEDVYEFHFKYEVPTKKVRLSLLQIDDLINFMKIYNDLNPSWKDRSCKLIKAKEIK